VDREGLLVGVFHSGSPTRSSSSYRTGAPWRDCHGASCRTSGGLLVEGNLEPHHHLVCTRCKAVQDIEGDFINFKRLAGRDRAASI
jgi:hypothetical protein